MVIFAYAPWFSVLTTYGRNSYIFDANKQGLKSGMQVEVCHGMGPMDRRQLKFLNRKHFVNDELTQLRRE